jgi:hypothetical protein
MNICTVPGMIELTLEFSRSTSWFVAKSIVAVTNSTRVRRGTCVEMAGGGRYEVMETPPEVMAAIEEALS